MNLEARGVSITLNIRSLNDLIPLRELYKNGEVDLNLSAIGRELNIDRRTVKKILLGDDKENIRNKKSELDDYKDFIVFLLEESSKKFTTFKYLYNYLKKSRQIKSSYSTFTYFMRTNKDLLKLFEEARNRKSTTFSPSSVILTLYGEEAQLDWKEDIPIVLDNREHIKVNVLVLILSHSRYRLARMTTSKEQTVLIHLLTSMFIELGGVPKKIKIDNMKTIMDDPKTFSSAGKINVRFEQFAKDFGFKIDPCRAYSPHLKGKVEQPNRIYEEIMAYNGELTLKGFNEKIKSITKNENNRYHKSYNLTPSIEFIVEKKFLNPLPPEEIRNYYTIKTQKRIVSNRCLIDYNNNKYSVPAQYAGQGVYIRCYDNLLHIYSIIPESKLINIFKINDSNNTNNIIYTKSDYESILKSRNKYPDDIVKQYTNDYFDKLTKLTEIKNDKLWTITK